MPCFTCPLNQAMENLHHVNEQKWREGVPWRKPLDILEKKTKEDYKIFRFEREELKIQVWENHQKAKTEAEMRKIEVWQLTCLKKFSAHVAGPIKTNTCTFQVEVERIRGRAHDRLMNKLAAARHKAEEKRAAAEAKRSRQAAKTEQQAEYIRKTGRIPSSFSCWNWCS
ncbi:hypothetical protein CK203_015885 [Vitis vinifera]|uniref:Remorin C-terminal domain-containing protein n=1 Tax=Vitis vinifera TaxID=29760 RepID=A0A438JRM1_VITVI|nr:hypothetical protein CK203_015885 [Vitis vinifera]